MSKITITILGTTAGAPTKDRGHAALHVSHDDGETLSLLFDCGEGTQRQLMRAGINLMDIDNIFVTHWHGDHCLGLAGLIDTMGFEGRQRPLYVHSPEPRRLKIFLAVTRSHRKFKVISRKVPFRGRKKALVFENARLRVYASPVDHGVPAVAYAVEEKEKINIDAEKAAAAGLPRSGRIYGELKKTGNAVFAGRKIYLNDVSAAGTGKKIVYSGDTEICGSLRDLVRGADLLVQDCTYFYDTGDEARYPHASLPEVAAMTREENVKRTVLTHLSRRHDNISELRSMIKDMPGFEVAEDLCRFVV